MTTSPMISGLPRRFTRFARPVAFSRALSRPAVAGLCALALLGTVAGCAQTGAPARSEADAARDAHAAATRPLLDTEAFDAALKRDALRASATADTAPPKAAAAAPVPARVSLYFKAGATRLDDAQSARLEAAVRALGDRRPRWRVTAHTDLMGPLHVNERLARQRGAQVVERLVRLGIDRAAIDLVHAPATRLDALVRTTATSLVPHGTPRDPLGQARKVEVESDV